MRDALGSPQSLVVFGGTSDIGCAIARALAADRTRRVALAVRNVDAAESVTAEIRTTGAEVTLVEFDALDLDSHEAVVADVLPDGDVDVAVLAFGVLGPSGDEQLEAATLLQRVNGLGAVSVMTRMAERMRRQGHGTIVLLSSAAADRPRVANFAYGASKAAADAFARGLGDAVAGDGVEVLLVRPGFVRTRMTRSLKPAPLAVNAENVADAVVRALRQRRHIVYVPETLRWVMLVIRALPRALARRLPR